MLKAQPLLLLPLVASTPPPLSPYLVHEPHYRVLNTSNNSTLYALDLGDSTNYASGPPLLVHLKGTRHEVGRAYTALLGERTIALTDTFYNHLFPNATTRLAFELFADWVWDRFASKHVPNEFVEELDGLGDKLASITRRFNVLANMPADTKNLITLLEQELEKGLPQWEQALLNKIINHLDGCTWCDGGPTRFPHRKRLPTAPRCDAFATWGSRAKGGRLFSSRNLDWTSNTGAAASKLITVFDIIDDEAGPRRSVRDVWLCDWFWRGRGHVVQRHHRRRDEPRQFLHDV